MKDEINSYESHFLQHLFQLPKALAETSRQSPFVLKKKKLKKQNNEL